MLQHFVLIHNGLKYILYEYPVVNYKCVFCFEFWDMVNQKDNYMKYYNNTQILFSVESRKLRTKQ